jgi:hypothetical protein
MNPEFGLGTGDDSYILAKSKNLTDWEHVYSTGLLGAGSVFSGEFFVDGNDVHLLMAIGRAPYGFQIEEIHPTNADWTQWSSPVRLSGMTAYSVYDPCIVKLDGVYHLFAANAVTMDICEFVADTLLGPYTLESSFDWVSESSPFESEVVVPLPDGRYRMYLDHSVGMGLHYSDTAEPGVLSGWSDPIPVDMPFKASGPSVVAVSGKTPWANLVVSKPWCLPVDSQHFEGVFAQATLYFETIPVSDGETITIGDTVYDIEAAKANGAVAVAVNTGSTTADRLRAAGPDLLFPDLSDWRAVLAALRL